MIINTNIIITKIWRIVFLFKKVLYQPTDVRKAKNNRAELYKNIWREAAESLGVEYKLLDYGFIELTSKHKSTIVIDAHSEIDNFVTHRVISNKPLCHKRLMAKNIPVPEHIIFDVFDGFDKAEKFLRQVSSGIVVKPAIGTGAGMGVTTGIKTVSELRRAIAFSSLGRHSKLIAEKMVPGDCYRFLYLDGKLLDVVVRYPPSIIGDGKSTIDTLIKRDLKERYQQNAVTALGEITKDLEFHITLKSQGLTVRSVLKQDEKVILKKVINDGSSRDSKSVLSSVCEELAQEGAKAARVLGARFAGVDIITSNLSVSLKESGGVVLEVNASPGLHLHYLTQNPGKPPALALLKCLLAAD